MADIEADLTVPVACPSSRPTLSLTPIRQFDGVYNVLAEAPQLRGKLMPAYLLIPLNFWASDYAVLSADATAGSALVVKPLAVYTPLTRGSTHGIILDLTSLPGEPPLLARSPSPDCNVAPPARLRIAYGYDHRARNYIEMRISPTYSYRWTSLTTNGKGSDSTGPQYVLDRIATLDGLATTSLRVGRIYSAQFRCPRTNVKLWTIDIDTTYVNPVLALLTGFAFHDFSLGSYWAAFLSAKPSRVPKPVILVFEDNMGARAREWAHDQDSDDGDKEDSPRNHSAGTPSVEIIRVFERKNLLPYRLSDNILEEMSRELRVNSTERVSQWS